MDSIIIPPEIVTKILSNLGKSDLLNCRLVSHSWNKECLEHLRKSKFTQQLGTSSIKSYMEFIKSNQHPQFVLPFYIHVRIDFSNDIRIHEMREFIKHLTLLTNMFGPDCVIGLSLRWAEDESSGKFDIDWFVQLFNITYVRLEMLVLWCIPKQGVISIKLVGILKQRSTHFSNLKKLKLNTFYHWNNSSFVEFILENSPNIQKLTIYDNLTISSFPIRFERLKTLNIFYVRNTSELRNIQIIHSCPLLQKLKLGLMISSRGTEKNMFHDFFSLFSETIKSLTITLYADISPDQIIRFPKFPQLHNLKLILKNSCPTVPIYFNLNFNPDTFPMLKSIEVPVGCVCLSHCVLGKLSPDVSTYTSRLYSIFLNIQHLTLTVHHAHSLKSLNIISCHHQSCIIHDWNLKTSRLELHKTSGKLVKNLFYKNVEGLQSIFSNVIDIVIVEQSKEAEPHMQELIKALIQSDCEAERHMQELIKELIQSDGASIIRNFTLRNCKQDYLGQVLNQLRRRIVLENLKISPELEQTMKDVFQNITGSSDDISISRNVLNGTNSEKKIIVQENISVVNHNMKNVTTIRFEYSQVDEEGEIRSMRNGNMTMTVSMLDLTLIVNEFPNLCQIGMSSLLFDADQQKRSEQIHDIRTQFPTITINII